MRDFATGYIMIVRNQVHASIKEDVYHTFLLKTKGTYIVLYKTTPV